MKLHTLHNEYTAAIQHNEILKQMSKNEIFSFTEYLTFIKYCSPVSSLKSLP
jgi:hypothetical protein